MKIPPHEQAFVMVQTAPGLDKGAFRSRGLKWPADLDLKKLKPHEFLRKLPMYNVLMRALRVLRHKPSLRL